MSVQKLQRVIRMEINDNGKGFEMGCVLFAERRERLGLIGMWQRVELVGKSFAVVSIPCQGTTIHVQIPFHNGA